MQSPEHLLTEKEVADLFQVAEVTLRKWRNQGKIEFTQLGASIRYTPRQVADFIDRGRHPVLCAHCKESNSVA